MKLADFIAKYELFCPKELAVEGDPVGLQVGNPDKEVKKVLVTLDIREQTVQEAIDLGVDVIFAKHPLIFRALEALTTLDEQQKLVLDLVSSGIAVYTSHTNIDVVKGGLNDYFCELLGMTDIEVLDDDEGVGRIGNLPLTTLSALTEKVKTVFNLERLRIVTYHHDMLEKITRLALCGGSGGKFWPIAKEKGADVYLTGDIYYHAGHDMLSRGLLGIDPGHYIEKAFIPLVAEKMRSFETDVEIIESKVNTNPFYDI
ncbi:Nif3-like dinuclear metal center hexameric protein [Lactococcus allomyrinae]|uniref:GTP cyclohydrolase 1 type 2 homolog n=1 Tax=Lactococcus allomyrinae TaxID=2419773 RepID=A0A387BD80_9LACT|nr:Nif3-like dinuclear metal center hexameric protein [Lactococcus allomyrinae]AYG00224.1 Nif3-like dinuclear metal center hexameric protein [Lactococcus allomyrinae]